SASWPAHVFHELQTARVVQVAYVLMGLGSLATIGAEQPSNLGIVVLDNEHYGETGMQPAHTGRGVDLAAIAAATGFKLAVTVRTEGEVDSLAAQLFTVPG